MITPAQLRAARAFLDWTRTECGHALGVSSETIRNIENGRCKPALATVEKVRQGFARHGVRFVGHQGVTRVSTKEQQP